MSTPFVYIDQHQLLFFWPHLWRKKLTKELRLETAPNSLAMPFTNTLWNIFCFSLMSPGDRRKGASVCKWHSTIFQRKGKPSTLIVGCSYLCICMWLVYTHVNRGAQRNLESFQLQTVIFPLDPRTGYQYTQTVQSHRS